MALVYELLKPFCTANGISPAKFAFTRMPDNPDSVLLLAQTPGLPSTEVEDEIDYYGLQARSRAARDNAQNARDMANAFDRLIRNDANWPLQLGDSLILSAGRQGGPPTYLTTDNQNRVSYVGNYWLQVVHSPA